MRAETERQAERSNAQCGSNPLGHSSGQHLLHCLPVDKSFGSQVGHHNVAGRAGVVSQGQPFC